MKLDALLDVVRTEIDDLQEPFLWSDRELIEYADDAQNEACRRARLLLDSEDATVCRIVLEAGTAVYALDPRVIRVERAIVAGDVMPLRMCLRRHVDRMLPGWEDMTAGPPEVLIPDWQSRSIRLVPAPEQAGTLRLTVVRLPLVALNDLDDEPEIPEHFHRNLRHWIIHRAYLKRDSETFDEQASMKALAWFTEEFGRAQPAYDEAWVQSHYAGGEYGHY